jgi:hypothetical protein
LMPSAKPVHLWPYPVPHVHIQTFKCELDHLVEICVLVPTKENEWASPTFIPKKDGQVCWIGDLCQLNKVIKCRQYPIIFDIKHKRSVYKFFTKLDTTL